MRIALYSNCYGSGKSTLANLLVKEYGYKKYTLADSLKEIVHDKLDSMGVAYDPTDKVTPIKGKFTLRDFYINMGKRLVEERGPTWMIDEEQLDHDNVVIDDLRRPEELEALVNLGFLPVFVDRGLPTPDNPLEGLLKFNALKHGYFPNLVPYDCMLALTNLMLGTDTLTPEHMIDILTDIVDNKNMKYNMYDSEVDINYSIKDTKNYKGIIVKHSELGILGCPIVTKPTQLNSMYLPIKLITSMKELDVNSVTREVTYQTDALLKLDGEED